MAFPLLRVQQTRADDLIRPDYIRPNLRARPDKGLPPPGWPRGVTWVARVGQPVQGPLGGLLTPADGSYRDAVEVTARTGRYEPEWHRLGVPVDLARLLSEEREGRTLLLRGRTDVQTIAYVGVTYQGARPEDSMDRLYRDLRRTEVGNGYPVPPPRPRRNQETSEAEEESGDDEDRVSTDDSRDESSEAGPSHSGSERGAEGEGEKGATAPTPVVPQSRPEATRPSLPQPG